MAALETGSTLCISLLILGAGVLSASEPKILPAQREFFEKEIRPIFVTHCYECHDSTGDKLKGGLALNLPSGIRQGGDSGPKIATGDPETSLLIHAVRYGDRDLEMPPKSRLPKEAVASLEKWISMGAPDPREEDAEAIAKGIDLQAGRNFWAFQPITKPAVPERTASVSTDWDESLLPPTIGNEIDAFLEVKRKEHGLSPAGPSSRTDWLRRVTFDLTGLPPSPEEIDDFLADTVPGATSRVVERLLASPDYGVRWGRHWLDVARYSDSNGLDENLAFGNAWRYRDYVIESFNEDKPFDQFVVEQIAGDLIERPTEESITGTGFLALGARVLAEKDREKLDMDVIDEQIDTTGKAFLGLTLGCARCHDHKFDPVRQADYYSLAAIFKSSEFFAETKTGAIHHWYEHSFATGEDALEIKEWDEKIAATKKALSTFNSKQKIRMNGEARARAVEYLVAATRFGPEATLEEIANCAEDFQLHPRILHHCRNHLVYHRDHEVFAPWWSFVAKDDVAGLREFYEDKFGRAVLAFDEIRKKDKDAKELDDTELEPFRAALFDTSGFLAIPMKPEHAYDEVTLAKYHELEEAARVVESNAPDIPAVMGVTDSDEILEELPIHIRGSHLNLGEPVPRAVPAVFIEGVEEFPENSSGRLQLARWMASPDNPLTARVIVNRVWRWHFGQGLVKSTENFGTLGDRPSHPELLDWLTSWFIENNWSIKDLTRLIVSSQAYQMASDTPSEKVQETDPDNRLLSTFPVQRLEAEEIRDSILAVSGRLDREVGGKTIPLRNRQMVFNHTSEDFTTYGSLRRSAFLPIVRNHVFDWLHLFDYPDPTMPTGSRNSTTIAPQALLLMNSELARNSSKAFAARIFRSPERTIQQKIGDAWRLAYGRKPSPDEIEMAKDFIESVPGNGWDQFCQGIFASSEFIYVN